MSGQTDKRELLRHLVAGEASKGYVPAAFFLHFPAEFHRGETAVRKHEEFFRFTGMDFVKIQFELPFPTFTPNTPKDWATLPRLDASFFEPQVEVVRGLVNALKNEAPVVCTLYSPFMMAGQMGGEPTLIEHLSEDPDAVRPGLQTATDNTIAFVRAAIDAGLDGFYHSTQGGETGRFKDRSLFERYVSPTDLDVMCLIETDCDFNILHICDYNLATYGGYDSWGPFIQYPGHIVSCDSAKGGSDVVEAFNRPFMGGLDRLGLLATGTPDQVRNAARDALDRGPDRMILAADCTVPPNTPWENLQAAVEEAHRGR